MRRGKQGQEIVARKAPQALEELSTPVSVANGSQLIKNASA